MKKGVEFRADHKTLPRLLQWVHEQVSLLSFPAPRKRRIELVLEEVVVNIVEHAYARKGGVLTIFFEPQAEGALRVEVRDHGMAFNPLSFPKEPLVPKDIAESSPGGLGVPILRRYAEDVKYERLGEQNVLTLLWS